MRCDGTGCSKSEASLQNALWSSLMARERMKEGGLWRDSELQHHALSLAESNPQEGWPQSKRSGGSRGAGDGINQLSCL